MNTSTMDMTPDDRFLRLREVMVMIGLARSTIYERITAGTFPRPLYVGERSPRWRLSDILRWMSERMGPRPT